MKESRTCQETRANVDVAGRNLVADLFVFVATVIVILQWVIFARNDAGLSWDFPVFYIPAHLPIHSLYDQKAYEAFGKIHLAPLGIHYFAPYVRPSVFSIFHRPLALLGYWPAFWVWVGIGLAAYFASVFAIVHRLRLPAYVIPAFAAFFPAMVGLVSGQDITEFLALLALVWFLLSKRQDMAAGFLLSFALYKFNLILLLPLMLAFHRRFKALTCFAIGALVAAVASMILTSPSEYIRVLVNSSHTIPGYFPVGLAGLSSTFGYSWLYPLLSVLTLFVCTGLMKLLPFTEAFCVAVVGSLLISPHVTWYDATLLVLPLAVSFARGGPITRSVCLAILVASPLWHNGGGFSKKPGGLMHPVVELFLLASLTYTSGMIRFGSSKPDLCRVLIPLFRHKVELGFGTASIWKRPELRGK